MANSTLTTRAVQPRVPVVIHIVNLVALLTLSVILLLTAVVRFYQLIILVPLLALAPLYWYFRSSRAIVVPCFWLSVSIMSWVILCENIVNIDKILGSEITKQLRLGLSLQSYVEGRLGRSFQECCNDPLSYNRRPGLKYQSRYDCPACTTPYEVIVDETGFGNRQLGLYKASSRIDLFFAGDSLLAGIGTPSVVEFVKDATPVKIWNLSVEGWGPRQKINALITYALAKRPDWLVVDFYSGNDVSDAIVDEVCQETGDFHCRFSIPEVRGRLLSHPAYHSMLETLPGLFEKFSQLCGDYLTLAVTKFVVANVKNGVRKKLFGAVQYSLHLSRSPIKRNSILPTYHTLRILALFRFVVENY